MKRLVLFFLVALLSLAAPVLGQEPPTYPSGGCVVTTGLPAAPILEKAGAGVLSFTFNSLQQPWSPAERDSLQSWIATFLPVMEEVYGPPALSLTVNIVKDSTISYAGSYGGDGTITLKVSSVLPLNRESGVLVHEVGHAFRHGFHLYGGWEEGMVRALEVEVYRILGWPHWDATHSYYFDVWLEVLNKPDIGGNFFGGMFTLLRYQAAGYAWKKVLLEAEDFFRDFNASLYADPSISSYVATYRPCRVDR